MANELFNFSEAQKRDIIRYVAEQLTANNTSISNLNAWATALATKLNADVGVTDTNYDTNPQA